MKDYDKRGYFDSEINKYNLDHSTFDLIYVDAFKNTKFSTVFWYLMTWLMMFLSWILLGTDIYTCLNILVFHHWSSDKYKPYAYSIAKWIFTGCIIFEFALLLYHWIWAVRAYKTRNIALAYVNSIARLLYIVKSYNYFCLFHAIEEDNFFDWACFLSYSELDNALQILIADTPRQVINILTLRYYATDGDMSNDIISNIKEIANTNLTLSIVLSFICLSVVIWSIFFFKFLFGMLLYVPIKVKLKKREFKSLKKYCCMVVNRTVRQLVRNHHRPKSELIEKGVLDLKDIAENPLLNSSTTTFIDGFNYKGILPSKTSIAKPDAIHTIHEDYRYNDNKKLYNFAQDSKSYEDMQMSDLTAEKTLLDKPMHNADVYKTRNESVSSLAYPFSDRYKVDYKDQESEIGYNEYSRNESEVALVSNPFIDDNSSVPKIPLAKTYSSSIASTYRHTSMDDTESRQGSRGSNNFPYPIDIHHEKSNLMHERQAPSFNDDHELKSSYAQEDKNSDSDSESSISVDNYSGSSMENSHSHDNRKPSTTPYPYRGSSMFD